MTSLVFRVLICLLSRVVGAAEYEVDVLTTTVQRTSDVSTRLQIANAQALQDHETFNIGVRLPRAQ